MLERTSEKLIEALGDLESLTLKDRNLFLDAKAQGIVLLGLIGKLMRAPQESINPEDVEKAEAIVGEFQRTVEHLKQFDTSNEVA